MKWNTPAVAELDVRMTENGWLDCEYEACWVLHDSKKTDKTPVDDKLS